MDCSIDKNKFDKLATTVLGHLLSQMKSNIPFNMQSYTKSLYNAILNKTGDHILATSYVMALPYALVEIQHNGKAKDHILDSYPTIVRLKETFKDFDKTVEYLGISKNNINQLKNIQEIANKTEKTTIPKESYPISGEKAKPYQVTTTTGIETIVTTDPVTGVKTYTNTLDPDKKLYYDTLKNILDKVLTPLVNGDSSKLNIPGAGNGIFLTALSAGKIPNEHLYEETRQWLNESGISESEKEIRKNKHEKLGVVLALTTNEGKLLHFNDKSEVVMFGEGKPVYYLMRSTDERGNLTSPDSIQTQEQISKSLSRLFNRPVTVEEAKTFQNDQIKQIHEIRDYIKKDPENNFIRSIITGGSKGIIQEDRKNPQDFSKLNFDLDHPFNLQFDQDGNTLNQGKAVFYFYYPGISTPIRLQRKSFTKDIASKVSSLLIDDIYTKSPKGEIVPLNLYDKLRFVKNYIQTSQEGLDIQPLEDGTLQITLKGEVLDTSNKDLTKKVLEDFLTRLTPSVIVSKPEKNIVVLDGSKPGFEKDLRQGSIVKTIDKNGKEVYTKYRAAQVNINRKFITRMEDFQDFSIDSQADKNMLTPTDKNFKDFLGEHTYIDYPINEQGKIIALNGYFSYSPLEEDLEKSKPKEVKEEILLLKEQLHNMLPLTSKKVDPSIADQRQKDIDDLLNTINKTTGQKLTNRQATSDQLDAARLWYSKSPLSKHFPFQVIFNMVNTANPNVVATWAMHGITLYAGADYTDLYHEAWHGFTQGFLTKDQKSDLYNELRKRSGSFKTYQGKQTTFKAADNLELEEYLAEDFRSYVLSGGKKTTNPIRNSIFRKILNFFKALFGNSTVAQVTNNEKSIATINDLYEKLRVGDLNEYTFSDENVNFNILNKGLEAIDKLEPIKSLSYEDSRTIVDTIDSLFSELIDLKNSKEGVNRFTSSIITSVKGRVAAYKYAQLRLAHIRNDFAKTIEDTPEGLKRTQLQKNIDLLDYTIRNFGDPENPLQKGKGLIGYHNLKSKYLSFEDKYLELTPDDNTIDRDQYRNRNGNESSLTELASKETLYLIRSLYDVKTDGSPKKNKLGLNQLADFNIVWNRLAKVLEGSSSPEVMYNKINKESESFPIFKQLLAKLGPTNTIATQEFNMWTSFWNDFNKTRIPLIQMTLDKVTDVDGNIIYISKIGNSSTDFKKAGQTWSNRFQLITENNYIKKDKNGSNYLDIPNVLKDFSASSLKDEAFNFFRAIGVDLSDKKEIREAINKGVGKANVIRQALTNLQAQGVVIKDLSKIFDAYDHLQNLPGEKSNYNKLQELETRYSDQYSNFSVTNAEGNSQFEHSLNSTATQIINTINSVKSFNELIDLPYMNHLDPDRNPYIKNSIWINSLFDMNSPGRPKRKDVKFNLENLSGIQLTKDGEFENVGVASASADEVTKFLLDFHMMILKGTPEFMRTADKGTSLSGNITKILTPGNKGGKLYIDTEQFIADPVKAQSNLNDIVIKYISGELSRIQIMNSASEIDPIRNVANYYNKGKEFQLFDDVLSLDTKSDLKKITGSLENYLNTGSPESIILRQNLENDINEYFDKLNKAAIDRFNKSKFTATNMVSAIKLEAKGTDYSSAIQASGPVNVIQGSLKSFTVNQWIHNVETMNILYGDIAQYNMLKEEFHKRNAGLISTGTIYRTDDTAMRYINEVVGFGYAASKGITQDKFSTILNTGIVKDNNIKSAYYDINKTAITKDITDRYNKRKDYLEGRISKKDLDAEISKAIESAMKPYSEMNTGDAQGWITFDSLRIIKTLDNSWTPDHEILYQKIVKEEYVSPTDTTKFFPVQKLQYWGPLHTDGLPVMAFHKFSVFPLIPTVIKGTNLEVLHNKMMNQNIHYSLFESGSKISTITNQGVVNPFYSDDKTKVLSQDILTKNPIFLHYLKNQLKTAPDFKENITFSTQLRKLIEDGLYENGKPINEHAEALVKNYEDNIRKLTEVKKKELLREAGWILDKNGVPKGNLKPLLDFVRKELTRQDLADHQIDFIDIKGNTNELKHDLSISLSAEKIEKLLTAIVNKRLIRQNVTGEGLIQVSGAGFERLDAFTPERNLTNPTEGDLRKYGSNDLPTYHPGTDGKTRAMKVKIALQGNFKKLLELPEVNDRAFKNNIDRLQALNQLLKDEPWLNTGNNRQMITMVGVRIPVQGLNSMEFMEVHEFLPREAGNIIIAPDEIVAKSGSDFDIDKLTVMMPNLIFEREYKKGGSFKGISKGNVILARTYNKDEAKDLYDRIRDKVISIEELKDTDGTIIWSNDEPVDKLLTDLFGNFWKLEYIQDELNELLKGTNLKNFDDFYETLNGSKVVENELLKNMKDILEMKNNYTNLIRPNGTDIVKPVADKLQDSVQEYNPKSRTHEGNNKVVSGTRVLEMEYNLYKHQSNNIGKQVLGMGAVDNTYNVVFNRVGAHLNSTYEKKGPDSKMYERPLDIYLPHNSVDINGKRSISLSNILDANGQYRISDVISQLINGWVDVAKDAWIFNIQGNKEVTPVLLFMIQSGVPFEQAVYFVSQPLVREYVNQQRLAKSTFADPLGKAPVDSEGNIQPNWFRVKAKNSILLDPKYKFRINKEKLFTKAQEQNIYNLTREMIHQYKDTAFNKESLERNIGKKENIGTTPEEQTVFLHYLQLEDMSRSIRDIKLRMNFDTNRSTTLFEAHNRELQKELLKLDGKLPSNIADNILTNSPIGSFNIQEFMIKLWNPMFTLRNNEVVEKYLVNKIRDKFNKDINGIFDDTEDFASSFKNDLVSFIFQNSVKDFDISSIKNYKGFNVDETIPVESVNSLKNGVFVKDKVIYVDKNQLLKDYTTKAWSNTINLRDHLTNYNSQKGLASVNVNAFSTPKEYNSFVFEREYLRSTYDSNKIKTNMDYLRLLRLNSDPESKSFIKRFKDESQEDYASRLKFVSYEQFLRDQALDNTFNSWKMFNSDTSYTDEYNRIVDAHPELRNDYLLFRILASSVSKQKMKNLYSIDSKLDGDKLNTLHENLLNLSNPSVIKSTDPVENQRISDFFKRFPIYAFMQSGLTTTGKFSLINFVPTDMFTRIMEGPIKEYSKKINNNILDKFYKKFTSLAQSKNGFRHKNWIIEDRLDQTLSKSQINIIEETIVKVPITDTIMPGIKEFFSFDYAKSSIINMVASNPEAVFVYSRTQDPKLSGYKNTNGAIQDAHVGFILGIPTKLKYPESTPNNLMLSVNNTLTDKTLDENKRLIDVAIAQLLDFKAQGRDIVFDKNGYGQGMIGRSMKGVLIEVPGKIIPKPGQQTFLYLSEQLYNNFNYINNNYLLQPEGRQLVQSAQPVTDQEVKDFINQCINF